MNSEKTNVLNRRRRMLTGLYVAGLILVRGNLGFSEVEKTPPEKPKVAVLPLAGDGRPDERERAVFSIRQKLDRQGVLAQLKRGAAIPGAELSNAKPVLMVRTK